MSHGRPAYLRARFLGTRFLIDPLEVRRLFAAVPYYDLSQATQDSSPSQFTAFDGQVLFTASGPLGREPFITDGTPAGTRLLADIVPGSGGSSPPNFFVWNERAYFTVFRLSAGTELWSTDGSSSGALKVAQLTTGGSSLTFCGSTVLSTARSLQFREAQARTAGRQFSGTNS